MVGGCFCCDGCSSCCCFSYRCCCFCCYSCMCNLLVLLVFADDFAAAFSKVSGCSLFCCCSCCYCPCWYNVPFFFNLCLFTFLVKNRYAEYLSVESYPEPYCEMAESMETACFENSILELWAEDGGYGQATDAAMEALTREDVRAKKSHSLIFLNNNDSSNNFRSWPRSML